MATRDAQINSSSRSPLGYHFPWHNEVTAETTDSFAAILAKSRG